MKRCVICQICGLSYIEQSMMTDCVNVDLFTNKRATWTIHECTIKENRELNKTQKLDQDGGNVPSRHSLASIFLHYPDTQSEDYCQHIACNFTVHLEFVGVILVTGSPKGVLKEQANQQATAYHHSR